MSKSKLPYPQITKIPDTEPDAVPSLWNDTYLEIDANFADLENRIGEKVETLIDPDPSDLFLKVLDMSFEDGNIEFGSGCKCTNLAEDIHYGESSVKDALDTLFYVPVGITSFTNNHELNELGSTVEELKLRWTLRGTPSLISINGENVDAGLLELTLEDQAIAQDAVYRLEVKDERGNTSADTTFVSFANGLYYGASYDSEITSAFIQSLSKKLTNSRLHTFSVDAGDDRYIFFAMPVRLGTPTFVVGGFEGGFFSKLGEFDFTNALGYSEKYAVYRSDNAGLGVTEVEVR